MTTTSSPLPPPQTLGRYTLINRLASGGMGEIFLGAAHGPAGFEKQVAIKRILPHLAAQDEFVQRFIDEAHIVVSLTHGNIVPVLDMGVADGSYFIAMEYIDGKDLRAILKQAREQGAGPIPPELAIYIGSQLCQGLAYAHRKTSDDGQALHIVHRDVSPSNVLISWEGQVKLTDFGVARALGRSLDSVTGSLRGKLSYMSPEQARGDTVDHRSDIYAAGIVVWELLCGRRLFDGDSDTEVLKKVQKSQVPVPSELVAGIPEGLDEVVMKALSAQRTDRYEQMDDFANALGRLRFASLEPAAGATQLSQLLRELFPQQAAQPPRPPSFDELLAQGPELQAVEELTRTLAGDDGSRASRPASELAADPGSPETPPGLGWLLPLMLLGLTIGYLGAHPSAPPSGGLLVRSTPPGAMVRVAGVDMGITPWSGRALPAQSRSIELHVLHPGHQPFREQLKIRAGDRRVVHAQLLPDPIGQSDSNGAPLVSPLLTPGPPPWSRRPTPPDQPTQVVAQRSDAARAEGSKQTQKTARTKTAKRAEKTGTLFFRVKPTGLITVAGKTHRSPITGLELPVGSYSARVRHPQWKVNRRVKLRIRNRRETRKVISLKPPHKKKRKRARR